MASSMEPTIGQAGMKNQMFGSTTTRGGDHAIKIVKTKTFYCEFCIPWQGGHTTVSRRVFAAASINSIFMAVFQSTTKLTNPTWQRHKLIIFVCVIQIFSNVQLGGTTSLMRSSAHGGLFLFLILEDLFCCLFLLLIVFIIYKMSLTWDCCKENTIFYFNRQTDRPTDRQAISHFHLCLFWYPKYDCGM